MNAYVVTLNLACFVAAVCAGFMLAASPRQRATQLAASLAAGASWWALCEARWNVAPDAATALLWMRLSAPGWCFLGAVVPHLMARYLDLYPSPELSRRRAILLRVTAFGYAVGFAMLAATWLTRSVHGELLRVPWGWTYAPGPAMVAYAAAILPGIVYAIVTMMRNFQSPLAVAPRAHRISIRIGILLPLVLTPLTDVALPLAGVPFPRLGSTAYALFGLVALGTGLRFGMSFFTPKLFSDEILDTLHEGVAMITPGGLIRRANRGLARLSGCEVETLVGSPLARVLDWQPPEQPAPVEEQQTTLHTAAGERIPVSVSATPLRDERGNTMGLVVVARDLREIEELRRRMLTQARLAAVGELAAGLAHEINNPLAYVRSNLALLERHWKTLGEPGALPGEERAAVAEESRELIAESLVGVDRAADIVRGVRRFTHGGTTIREPADLNQLLEDAISMLRPRVQPPELTLELHAGEIPRVPCSPQELRQVFLNLLVNALDAVGARGRVTATTRQDGDEVLVEIRDDGCGMTPEVLERIFDPFFTTKGVGEGTGLGLGIAWHIVRAHGGQIAVESEAGVGTVFGVRVPVKGVPEVS